MSCCGKALRGGEAEMSGNQMQGRVDDKKNGRDELLRGQNESGGGQCRVIEDESGEVGRSLHRAGAGQSTIQQQRCGLLVVCVWFTILGQILRMK